MFCGRFIQCQTTSFQLRRQTVRVFLDKCPTSFDSQHLFQRARLNLGRSMSTTGPDVHPSAPSRNRLSLERSPYLLQHAANPVDWYPWGQEAIDLARQHDKLIFLSVGYSTCHWCHVMERESFENEAIASEMNRRFVNVKVDREERPDIDKVYMTFVQASTGGGGWPMSVWLTPDLTPVFGGTYFPPEDQRGQRPGFKSLLEIIHSQWQTNRAALVASGHRVVSSLQTASGLDATPSPSPPPASCATTCLRQLAASYDATHGGFGAAPKFPQPPLLAFLLHHHARHPQSEALAMCRGTLDAMARGGIRDHVGKGFARYATDAKWHVPHFEKMLYDQAQLLAVYADAWVATGEQEYKEVVRDIVAYVQRDLGHKSGGFYSAEDADSLPSAGAARKLEGAFYTWTRAEIDRLLPDRVEGTSVRRSDMFAFHYDVRAEGNVDPAQDPHGELTGTNVLMATGSVQETAAHFGLNAEATQLVLRACEEKLYEARMSRPRPHLDDKMIAAWNGLMITGLAKASQALNDPSYEERAVSAANFVKQHLYDTESGTLLRSCYRREDGKIAQISVPIAGFLSDYAFVIRGLLDLYETCLDADWLEWAELLQDTQDRLFWDEKDAGYFCTAADDETVIMRLKDDQDGAEPSGNSVAASNLLRLAAYLERGDYHDKVARLLTAFTTRLTKVPLAVPELATALVTYHESVTQVFVTGQRRDADTDALLATVRSRLVAGRVLALADARTDSVLYRKCPAVRGMKAVRGKAAAFVCRHHTCSLPVNTPEALAALLDQRD